MADKNSQDDVKIYEPDRTLHTKIGNANLDQILTPQIVEEAQTTITKSADQFIDETTPVIQELEQACKALRGAPNNVDPILKKIVDAAFSIKTKTGLGGYDLVASLAKSLQLQAEQVLGKPLASKNVEIIQWHVDSINQLFATKMKGGGGEMGKAIMAELNRLAGKKS